VEAYPNWRRSCFQACSKTNLYVHRPSWEVHIQVRLDVSGALDPLVDPRVPRLIVAVRNYRGRNAAALYAADADWNLTVTHATHISYLP